MSNVVCPSKDLTGLLATVSMNLSTDAMGRQFERQRIEDVEWFEDDMVDHNSYLGASKDTSPGCRPKLADNRMERCSKLDIGVGGCQCCHKPYVGFDRERVVFEDCSRSVYGRSWDMAAEHCSTEWVMSMNSATSV